MFLFFPSYFKFDRKCVLSDGPVVRAQDEKGFANKLTLVLFALKKRNRNKRDMVRNIEARSRDRSCRLKTKSISYFFVCVCARTHECVSVCPCVRLCGCVGSLLYARARSRVALLTQHAKRMRRVILSSAASLAPPHFSSLSHKRHDFRKNVIECMF
jgi:hypothetical protein